MQASACIRNLVVGRWLMLGVWAGVCLTGCGGSAWARGYLVQPASVPVRAFPNVWVLRGESMLEDRIAERFAAHVGASGRTRVEMISRHQWEESRRAGKMRPATVVVMFRLGVDEEMHSRWATRPESICNAWGCYTVQRSYVYEVPTVTGKLVLIVYDAKSGRRLQRLTLRTMGKSTSRQRAREHVADTLARRAQALTSQRKRMIEVELIDVDLPQTRRALDLMRAGRWLQGREVLEQLERGGRLVWLPAVKRARVYYNLGQARRFGRRRAEDELHGLRTAEQALRQAQRLDPQPRYARAIHALSRQVHSAQIVLDQRTAAEHNLRLESQLALPSPPPS